MKQVHPWHGSRTGRVVLWLGSVQLAVPVLALVAAALAWGTFLESAHGSKVSRAIVYGSPWFIGLMVLVCLSLIFAVITRYPWKRKHIGFMTVHASLIALILGSFWSFFGRIEGRLALEEGSSSSQFEMDDERLELAEHVAGQFAPLGGAPAPAAAASLTLGGIPVQVMERWENSLEEETVTDNGPQPLRAVEVSFDPAPPATSGTWIGEEGKTGGINTLRDLHFRVLPDGTNWDPPSGPAGAQGSQAGFAFMVGQTRYLLSPTAAPGQEAFPGWMFASVKLFAHAMVGAGGLTEAQSDTDNPAAEIIITDGKGTSERHTAFLKFPDMVMTKTLEGTAASGAHLAGSPGGAAVETLVIYGPANALRIGYIAPDGSGRRIDRDAAAAQLLPWTVDLGTRRIAILRQFTRAHAESRFVRADPAAERRPALVVRVGTGDPVVAPWNAMTPVVMPGRTLAIRFGPRTVPLPFTVHLTDFRKTDYPGTDMAMSYESDVAVTLDSGAPEQPFTIFMNHPYAHGSWKVYQSGFVGENVSIFSVMRDPGLPLTYIGSIGLCLGILVTFYSRSLSWGHPGIPAAFVEEKEQRNASPRPLVPDAAPAGELVGAGSV